MVYSWIFPARGGGWARRYLTFRKDIFRRSWQTKDRDPCSPITLFDFRRPHDAVDAARIHEKDLDTWRVSDDRVIGGFSKGTAVLLKSKADYESYISGAIIEHERNATAIDYAELSDHSEFIPFIRWEGTMDTTVGLQSSAQRSGFAALRSPEFPFSGANLQGLYNALELTCRSDGRTYTINLKVTSSIPNDIYQRNIQSTALRSLHESSLPAFEKFYLPFSNFALTAMGREREVFRELDDAISIESIGIAVMDGRDGDFRFDLARIRAVNVHEDYGVFEGPLKEED